jgi:hypothetical protein
MMISLTQASKSITGIDMNVLQDKVGHTKDSIQRTAESLGMKVAGEVMVVKKRCTFAKGRSIKGHELRPSTKK